LKDFAKFLFFKRSYKKLNFSFLFIVREQAPLDGECRPVKQSKIDHNCSLINLQWHLIFLWRKNQTDSILAGTDSTIPSKLTSVIVFNIGDFRYWTIILAVLFSTKTSLRACQLIEKTTVVDAAKIKTRKYRLR